MRTLALLIVAAAVAALTASCSLGQAGDSSVCYDEHEFARLIAGDAGVDAVAKAYPQVGDRKAFCEADARDSTALVEFRIPRGVRVGLAEDRVSAALAAHGWEARSTDCLEKTIDGHLVTTVLYIEPTGALHGPASVNLSMNGYLHGDSRCEDMEN